jgi:hypothetical protein
MEDAVALTEAMLTADDVEEAVVDAVEEETIMSI